MKLLVSILALLYITNSAAIQLCSSPGEIYNYMHQNCSEYAAPVIGTVGQDLQYPNNHEFDLPQGGVLIIRLYSVLVLSSFSNSLQFAITERTGQPEFSQFINGWLMMDGSKYVPGQVYYVCSETTIPNYNTSLYNPIETCATVKIKGFVPLLVDPTPSNGSVATAYAGQAINLRFAVNTSVIGGCDYIVNQSQCSVIEQGSACACQENCTGDCKCLQYCAPGPLPLLTVVPGMSSPMTSSGLPQSSSWALESSSPLDRPQVWRFSWTPSALDRSAAPVRMCFRASLSKTAVASNGQTLLLCVGILIDKCRHYVQPGDSLEKIAAVFQKDWLTLYHANPNLPGYSPTSLTPGHLLRLGVSYAVRWGEDMSQVSRNFLLTPLDIHLTNPELVAPVQLSYKINTGQDNVQISLSFVPRRTIAGGENVTISLPDFAGSSWSGLVSEGCASTTPVSLYAFCDPALNRPSQPCGPGLSGLCAYDGNGRLYCSMPQCVGTGAHPWIDRATWISSMQQLVLTMKRTMAGQLVQLVVPQSSGLRKMKEVKAPLEYVASLPVQEKIYNPVSESMEQNNLCVILPLCQDGLTCLFGTDCKIQPSTWA